MELNYMKLQIFEVGLLILAAYLGGLIARKLKIGEVIGQILGGVIVGPHFLEIVHRILEHNRNLENIFILKPIYHFFDNTFPVYAKIFENFHFFVFLFLGLIVFSIGEELHRDRIKEVGGKAAFIFISQGLLTSIFLFLGFWLIFKFDIIIALIIGSIGIATAPTVTFLLINKLNIEGKLKSILGNVLVLDNIMEVILFSLFLGIAVVMSKGQHVSGLHITIQVLKDLFFAGLTGVIIFLFLKFTVKRRLPEDTEFAEQSSFLSTVISEHPTPSVEILLMIIAVVSIGIAVAIHFSLPFLITAFVAGFLISNFHSHAIFDSLKIENVTPIMNLFFFAIIGATVRIESFSKDTLIFVIGYLILRSIGKLFGNWLGCKITCQDRKITAALPKLMLPQAGVAAVETILVASILKNKIGAKIVDIIIPSIIIFEFVGAWLSEKTLIKWKNWIVGAKETLQKTEIGEAQFSMNELIENRVIRLLASTKEQAIKELAHIFVKEGIISEKEIITNPVLEREKLGSTAIGKGIAFPHCRISSSKNTKVALGIPQNTINWDAPDHKPVELIFLILTPERFPDQYLKTTRSIILLLQKPEFKGNIKRLKPDDIVDYLQNISPTLT